MIRSLLKRSAILNFNQVERDRWIVGRAAAVPPGSRVLDVACGSSPYRALFAHCEYRTQDFAQLPPEELRGGKGYAAIDYVCDAAAIPVPDASFDVAVCTEALEHFPEPERVVREIARLLKPGGLVLLTAPLGSGIHQAPHHYFGGFTPFWYRRVLAAVGFAEPEVAANGGFFKHYGQESIRFARLLAPWRHPPLAALAVALPWLLLLPWLAALCPLLCHLLDRLDRERGFTVGYLVAARRAGAPPAA
jgi:ubiquinone/menaquinone biosynthesis C-methylase UbiE